MTVLCFSPFSYRAARCAAFVCALAVSAGPPRASADDGANEQDLQGILPDYIPDGLNEGDFNQLQGNWADWSRETGRLVSDFYASDDDAVRGRRETLEQIKVKLGTMETALNDTQYLSIYGPLADLYGRLSRRVGVAEAVLATLDADLSATAQSRFESSLGELARDARNLRAHFQSISGGEGWVRYFRLNEIVDAVDAGDASAEMVELLQQVQDKLDDRTRLEEQQRAFLSRESVLQFEDSLGTALALLQARDPQAYRQYVRDVAADLMAALEDYELEPTAANMQAVRDTFEDLRQSAADGGVALTQAMRRYYLNFNLRIVMAESLLQDIVRDSKMESGYINEMVDNARVTGCQWTNTTVNLDLKPSDTGVRFDLLVNGSVRSTAQGETHVATVYTTGQHSFNARKSVHFDGDRFQHWCASVSVGGVVCPYAAQTCLSCIPLVGGLSENLALKVANDRGPETNASARSKIGQAVRSQFDRETGKMLREGEVALEDKLAGPLREEGYYPDVKEFRSTETEVLVRTRLMEAGELGGGDALVFPLYPTHGILVQMHESLLNQVGDRLELQGRRFTPEELDQYLKSEIEKITGQPVDVDLANKDNPDPNSPKVEEIIFHEQDPARFQIRGGEVVLILSMGLKLEDREEIPPQRITVPLAFSLAGDKIVMQRGIVGVSPIGPVDPRERAAQITRAGVMRSKIQEAFEPQEFDSVFTTALGEKEVTLKVTDLRARSGWLSIIGTDGVTKKRPGSDAQPSPQPQQVRHNPSNTIR